MSTEPFSEFVWIGLSNCDEHRERRTRFAKKMSEQLADYQVLLVDGGQLFHEALCCFQNGGFMAMTIMCRASLEAAVYTVLTRTPIARPPMFSATIRIDAIQTNWGPIMETAKQQGIVDATMEQMIKRIRDQGNFVAHYGQNFDRSLLPPRKDGDQRPAKLWIPEKMAMDLLETSLKVLNSLISKYTAKSSSSTMTF